LNSANVSTNAIGSNSYSDQSQLLSHPAVRAAESRLTTNKQDTVDWGSLSMATDRDGRTEVCRNSPGDKTGTVVFGLD
jgi:hypothetical protein